MARSYVSYDEFLKAAQQEAEEQQLAYAADRRKRAQDSVSAMAAATSQEIDSLRKQYRSQSTQTEEGYRALYDENAVNERIARLNVEEAMANMGLTDSGLNRSQQTALAATRMRADAQTSAQKQAALDALLLSLNDSLTQKEQSLLDRTADLYAAAEQDMEKNAQSLYANATSRAKTQFDADVDYVNALLANERAAAEQASKERLAEANLQLQREKQAADIALAQQKAAASAARSASASATRSSSSTATTASERAKNVQILQDLLEKRVNIFNPEWRANYDELIEYYKNLVYNS